MPGTRKSIIPVADHSRRRFLSGTASVLAAGMVSQFAPGAALAATTRPRSLSLYHTHTGEKLSLEYHDGHAFIAESLSEINRYLRDFRTDEIYPIDTGLLDLLHDIKTLTGSEKTFEVISGYRSPATNAKLRGSSGGVAKRSLHMQGKAIDIRLSGYDTGKLHGLSKSLKKGGVGYYPKSDFIHVDTGRVRYW